MTDAHVPGGGAPVRQAPLPARVAGPRFGQAGLLLGGIGVVVLGILIAFLLVNDQVRTIVLLLLVVLGLISLSPRRGTYILLTFLPFMYFLRRQILYFNEFSKTDPVLIFPPLVSVMIVVGLFLMMPSTIIDYIRRSPVMKLVFLMLILFFAQVFNPLQGSLYTGLAGGMYFITPMLWAFIGLSLDERDMQHVFLLVIVIGCITALYGIYQHAFGFSQVEIRELESKGFLKMLGTETRVMSTFAALGDFSTYLAAAGFLAFAHFWRTKSRMLYLFAFVTMSFAMLWAASRTMILVLIFSVLMFLILQPKRKGGYVVRGLAVVLVVGLTYGYLYTFSAMDIYKAEGSHNPFLAHVIGGVAHPTEESSFKKRLGIWAYVSTRGLLDQPLGRGLGSTTTAADKFSASGRFEAESFLFEIIYGSSVIAAFLFVMILVSFYKEVLRLISLPGDAFMFKTGAALMSGFFLGSIFGVSIRDSISGPFAWLVLGWLAKEAVDRTRGSTREIEPA